jgi:hypothetical protein
VSENRLMNRRVCVWIGSVLGCALCWTAGIDGTGARAFGQELPPTGAAAVLAPLLPLQGAASIPPAVETSTIGTFVAAEVADLNSPDGQTVTNARAALVAGCPRSAGAPYHTAYATEVSAAVVKALSNAGTPLPVKVNLGVVVERVATNSGATQVQPAVLKLLADRSDAVAYWGCKAARPLVMSVVLQPGFTGRSPLFAAVVASVKQHADSGMAGYIAVEAYRALVVNPNNVPGTPAADVWPKLRPLYNPVLSLLALRTGLYAKGMVPSPDAEVGVPTFLSKAGQYTPQQKALAVQELVDLLDAAGQRVQALTVPQQLAELRPTLQNAASALDVFSGTNLLDKIYHMPPGITAANMAALCQTVYPTMQLQFRDLKKPPTLPPLPVAPAAGAPAGTAAAARP